nr:hypothetical protein [uncultured Clostridium sp.]
MVQNKRNNESYYQYRASCSIRKEDGTEEIKNYELETDILYGDLHFWNRFYYLKKSQNMLFDFASREPGIVKCRILQERLVLIPRFTYKSNKTVSKKGSLIKRLLLVIEVIVLLVLVMSRASAAGEEKMGDYVNSQVMSDFAAQGEEKIRQYMLDKD